MDRGERGQGVVEFALVLPVLMIIFAGIIDFGNVMSTRESIINAARVGARYATVHPSAWTNSDPAAMTTIEGVIQHEGGTAKIANTDSNIAISYWKPDGVTECGYYSASSNGFVGLSGNTQNSCVVPGNLIQVKVTYTYQVMMPWVQWAIGGNTMTITGTAEMAEEQ